MSAIIELLTPGAVAAGLPAASSKAVFQHFGQVAAREYSLDAGLVVERLTERERLGSTGFGSGIAIPHGKIDGLDHVVAMFATLEKPLDFQAVYRLIWCSACYRRPMLAQHISRRWRWRR